MSGSLSEHTFNLLFAHESSSLLQSGSSNRLFKLIHPPWTPKRRIIKFLVIGIGSSPGRALLLTTHLVRSDGRRCRPSASQFPVYCINPTRATKLLQDTSQARRTLPHYLQLHPCRLQLQPRLFHRHHHIADRQYGQILIRPVHPRLENVSNTPFKFHLFPLSRIKRAHPSVNQLHSPLPQSFLIIRLSFISQLLQPNCDILNIQWTSFTGKDNRVSLSALYQPS